LPTMAKSLLGHQKSLIKALISFYFLERREKLDSHPLHCLRQQSR
jgi:hypothetical protein